MKEKYLTSFILTMSILSMKVWNDGQKDNFNVPIMFLMMTDDDAIWSCD